MNTSISSAQRKAIAWLLIAQMATPWGIMPAAAAITPTPLVLSQVPLFVTSASKANVLLMLDNSNSMDEDASGAAVGGTSANSKSEIARTVAKSLVSTYTNKINMGLMAYKQAANTLQYLHNSPYDASYDPANYNAAFTGNRSSTTKKFRIPNPTSAGNYIHYNVALPFYAGSNQGNGFCYSNTANAAANSAHPDGFWQLTDSVTGPWDSYRCYNSKTGTSDVLPSSDGSNASTYGYTGNFYNGQFSPTDSDYAQNIVDFGRFLTWSYVSQTWFANTSPGRGYLHTPIQLLDSTQAGKLNTKLGTSQFASNKPTDAAYPLQNAGLTPIEGTLLTAKDYFGGSWSTASEGYTSSCYPLPESCGKNFVVLITDGLPSTDKNGALITSTATALSDAAAAAAALKTAGIETYVVGFALPYGANPSQLDMIATSGGTGTAYSASDTATLNTALAAIFSDIMSKVGSASSVATNSTSLNTSSTIFQAKFDSADWSGKMLAYVLNSDGTVPTSPTWDASTLLPSATSRNILTYKPSTAKGIPFRWPATPASPTTTELDVSQSTAIGSSGVLDYLRGDGSNEGTGASNYRVRATKLGDIVYSTPVYVGKPGAGYSDALETVKYSDFVTAKASRTPILYAGANDGMLHGFNATTGVEAMGYVPSKVYSNLALLSSKTYSHRYYVDGAPTPGDAFFGGAWHTVLVGGLNGGGQGIYALDVTTPSFTEAGAASTVLWEFTDVNNAATSITDGDPDLGYTYSQPAIGKMHDGKWAAVFGNGYNNTDSDGSASTSGNAVLYIVNVQTGELIKKIDTSKGMVESANGTTPNGLASPALVDVDGDEIIDYIYAGDMQGNMWKFDVTATNPNTWDSAYIGTGKPKPLFTAMMGTTPQPITTQPEVGQHPQGGYLVYFGTGKYIETGDNATTGATTQTFYGIWDNSAAVTTGRTDLLQQKILAEVTSNSSDWRLTSVTPADWTTHKGWYMDLYNTQGGATSNYGEKQVSNPILYNQRIIFTTLTPSSAVCSGGGFSWLMELNPENGGRLSQTPFDVNNDKYFNSADYLTGGTVTENAPAGGTKLGDGIAGAPTIIKEPGKEHKYLSQSSGKLKEVSENPGVSSGRVSWREIMNNN
ncbi:MAG: pilus assembly protein [Sulfuricella sp.]